jgi:hypothetical protein
MGLRALFLVGISVPLDTLTIYVTSRLLSVSTISVFKKSEALFFPYTVTVHQTTILRVWFAV